MSVVTVGRNTHNMGVTREERAKPPLAVRVSTDGQEKGTTIMAFRTLAPAILAGAAATAVIFAPAAAAASSADCADNGPASVCTRNGHSAIYAEPRQIGTNFMIAPGGGPFGAGPMPPLLAMD